MTILKDVASELVAMFIGDAGLSAAILIVVAIAAGLVDGLDSMPLVGGGVLLIGCLGVVFGAVIHASRADRRRLE